ncbi:MAG: helix-turn-helix transcriptional regulator [Treponema sp.]|nr:helix-turn-helix transcriptional regulator [Treponema sp.]
MAKGNANVDYKKLWKLLIDKDMKKTDLITVAGISSNVLAKMNKGEFVSMESIQKVCKALDCDVGDICVMNESAGEKNDR